MKSREMVLGTERKEYSLRINFLFNLAGRGIYAISQWGTLMLVSKLLNAEAVGKYGLAMAITAPIFALAVLDLRTLLATDATSQYSFSGYLSVRIMTTLLALFVTASLALSLGYETQLVLLIMLVGISRSVENLSDISFGVMQKHERMDLVSFSTIAKGVTSLLIICGILLATRSLFWAIFCATTVSAIIMATYDLPNGLAMAQRDTSPQIRSHKQMLNGILLVSLPLGIALMLNSLNSNIPRYFLERYHGAASLGFFTALSYILVAGDTFVNSLGQVASPRLAQYYCYNDLAAFKKLLLKLTSLGALGGGAAVLISLLIGERLLSLIYTHEYASYNSVFVLLMTASVPIYATTFLNYSMIIMRLVRFQALIACMTVFTCLAAAWLLVPSWGLKGAAWAVVIAFSLKFLLTAATVRWHIVYFTKR